MNRTLTAVLVLTAALGCRRAHNTAPPPGAVVSVPSTAPMRPMLPTTATAPTAMPGPTAMPTAPAPTAPAPTAPAPTAPAPAAAGGGLTVPGTTAGTLAPSDSIVDGAYADDIAINLTAGAPVTIVVRGGPNAEDPTTSLDTMAILLLNGAEVARNDDMGGGTSPLNSRITFTPTDSGAYTLRVTTFGGSPRPGSYVVQTWPGLNESAE